MSFERTNVVTIPAALRVQLGDGRVDDVPLEDVVRSTLPAYQEPDAPPEALKAVAIAIRSDACASRQHARDGFDLCTSGHCFVWQPEARSAESDRATLDTRGQVLVLAGKRAGSKLLVPEAPVHGPQANADGEIPSDPSRPRVMRVVSAPFFQSCGGRTLSSQEAWGSPLSHCLGVACPCGSAERLGHGVGLCLAGASAMARAGAPAEAILKHYYACAEVVTATAVPRTQLRQSLIVGSVVDSAGRPIAASGLPVEPLVLLLRGPAGPFQRAMSRHGRFWFSGLPAGEWELIAKGTSFRLSGLHTDGRNTLETQVVMPGVLPGAIQELPPLHMETMPIAYPKTLIGTLGYGGVAVTITDPAGSQTTVESGSAPEFDPGGFVLPLPPAGPCTVSVLGQRFDFEIGPTGLWLRFSSAP